MRQHREREPGKFYRCPIFACLVHTPTYHATLNGRAVAASAAAAAVGVHWLSTMTCGLVWSSE